ncbi:unnamed protein product [Paramecium primaurelia]|uniref:Fungal lipase-type domain-containing protein n=1 Tax=Paramecium primaurelia TaxID=5886 RepID=A0A8S1QN19_PARPR|nr:unnamed protein product [Paramecium primaurelia]
MTYQQIIFVVLLCSFVQCQEYVHEFGEDIFQYTRASYCSIDIINAWDCEPCKRHPNMKHIQVHHNEEAQAQGYCAYDQDFNRIVVAIRGSVNAVNYLNDLDFIKRDYQYCTGCKVHQGFYDTYQNIAEGLINCVKDLNILYPDAQILVTGHSLGAAEATFAVLDIKRTVGRVNIFYNYGTPRIGNDKFADYVESELKGLFLARIIRDKDTFQHTPLPGQGFSHYGNEIFYDEKMMNFKVCGREDNKCGNKYIWPTQWKLDHHLYLYGQCAGCTQEGCENILKLYS